MNHVTRLNNNRLSALRRDPIYEAILTDLYLIGGVRKEVVEGLTGRKIADHLILPAEVKQHLAKTKVEAKESK